MRPDINIYINDVQSAIKGLFGPGDIFNGKEGALRLAREVGYGLKDYTNEEVDTILSSLYSRLLVVNSFSREGVPIDAKEFNTELKIFCNGK